MRDCEFEADGHAALVHAGDAQFVGLLDLALINRRAARERRIVLKVLLAQLGGEKHVALAARLRMPIRLQMQLEDDARLMMLTPEAADLVGIVAIERLRDGKTTLRGSDELRHLQQYHLTCRDIIHPEGGRRDEPPQVADVVVAFA